METYKGTDKDMRCRDFQYELGKKVETDIVECCERGFHSCETPMDVFSYYPPNGENRFFECKASGKISKQDINSSDSKLASSELKLKAEIGIAGLVQAQVDFVKKSAKTNAAQGYRGHAAAQGDEGHAAAQGDRGHAAAQGDRGHAEVHGKNSIAAAFGIDGKALGELGDWLVCAEWECEGNGWTIRCVKCGKVDGEKIKPNTWYMLKNGEFVETEE